MTLNTDETLELTVEYRRTDYTRYGVWVQRKTLADDSVSVDQTGLFAYSPLGSTEFTPDPDSDYRYPENVTAVYSGQTIALETTGDGDRETFTGSIELTVDWNATASAAELEAVIRDLRSLKDRDWFAVDGKDVDRIVFGTATITSNSQGTSFMNNSSEYLVWYRDPSLTRLSGNGTHSGKFVGRTIDGPVGVIGKWGISTLSLEGVYGAELKP